MPPQATRVPHPDTATILGDAAKRLDRPTRRLFLSRALGLGTLTLLGGCDVTDDFSAEALLSRSSDWNDRVQAWLFDPTNLAREYPEERIARPFPFNAFYPEAKAPVVDPSEFALELAGRVERSQPWRLDELYRLPRVTQVTRLVCIEGWSAIGKWQGVPFKDFLLRNGADLRAPFVAFRCEDGYSTSIDMATALHPQTQLTFWFDGEILPRRYGFPMRLRVPTKLGFKNPKHIYAIEVTDEATGGYWETYGYNWFSGL